MTTDEFVEIRVRELRDFFRGRFGQHWMRQLRKISGVPTGYLFLQRDSKPALFRLKSLEKLALSLGWKPAPFERKSFAKLMRILTEVKSCVSLPFLSSITLTRLCALTYHKNRPRALRDDVLSEEWEKLWCEDTRTFNPCVAEPVQEKPPPRFALDLLLADEVRLALTPPAAESPVTSAEQPVPSQQHPEGSNPTGGGEAGGGSLSAPRAVKNLSREELHRAINMGIDQLNSGPKDYLAPKLHVLSCIQRRIEGILAARDEAENAG